MDYLAGFVDDVQRHSGRIGSGLPLTRGSIDGHARIAAVADEYRDQNTQPKDYHPIYQCSYQLHFDFASYFVPR
jgi:hypothetical protein